MTLTSMHTRFLVLAALLIVCPHAARAQSAENVAVVINDNSPESQKIGMAYAAARSIPDSNVIHIRTTNTEVIDRLAFVATIEEPIATAIGRAQLHDRILYIVLTKGVPLRINGTIGQTGTIASVDSELTLLYRTMTGVISNPAGSVVNPYFLGDREPSEARPFTHRDFDIYLVSRIDGYTVDDALGLIEKGAAPKGAGTFVLDQRDALVNRTGETWMELAAKRLASKVGESQVLLEATPRPARDISGVLGYFSWGSTDPQNRVRTPGMTFVPGALAASFVGSDARTFVEPPAAWKPSGESLNRGGWHQGSSESLIGDLIRDGVTGVAGYVSQPLLSGTVRPQILFPAYVAGFNLIEAFYLAVPQLSWQTIVVGDPLSSPFPRKTLARADIEEGPDPATDLPTLFSKRRIAAALAAAPGTPEKAVTLRVRAEVLAARGDIAGARRSVEESVALAPRFVSGLLLYASLEETAGQRDQAIEAYRRILAVDKDHVIALNNLAYGLAVHRMMPLEALPYAERAVGRAPGNPTILETLGWVLFLTGDRTRAASVMQAAVRTNIQNPEIRLHAAIVFAAVGSRGLAERELGVALKLNPALATTPEVKELQTQLAN